MNTAIRKLFNTDMNSSFDNFGRNLLLYDWNTAFDDFGGFFQDVNFPKYNVVSTEDGMELEIALAGYAKDDINVKLSPDNILSVSSTAVKPIKSEDRTYLKHGIAARDFSIEYNIGEKLKVGDITFENGMLIIPLINVKPKAIEAKVLQIK